ncbi:MAG: winged helix-turn-helix domain-containing protein [Actinophytocola sp.]|nr:winged helix-turn-helix domain-containing protein [Actinophytocola sp.]
MRTISPAVARRIAVAAQGFGDARPGTTPTRQHLNRVLNRVRLLQLDSVNVAVRAHYAPLFARLGGYPMDLVDDAAWRHSARKPRLLVEYWAHAACLLPVADWPLLRHRMADYQRRYLERADSVANTVPHLADDVLAAVKDHGPIGAGALERELGLGAGPRRAGGWWNRTDVKRVCEWLFAAGELTTGTRQGFERRYDLPERVLPRDVIAAPDPDRADAVRELLVRSATALGIATEPDLRDYFRLSPEDSKRAVDELVEVGALEPVRVRGWRDVAYRHVDARAPRRVEGRALLCPFDPLIWERGRTERLFDFHYRIEIYVPEPQRVYGYYVFPFLLDGELVARVDLKADRSADVLRVRGAFSEPSADVAMVPAELAAELRLMAEWLGLSGVAVGDRGDLAAALEAVV